jgi:hypothetical protein
VTVSGRDWPLEPRHVPPAELDIPIFGQLATTHLPLGDGFEPGPLEGISLDAALRGWLLRQYPLEHATRDPDDAAVLPELPDATPRRGLGLAP